MSKKAALFAQAYLSYHVRQHLVARAPGQLCVTPTNNGYGHAGNEGLVLGGCGGVVMPVMLVAVVGKQRWG